MTKPAVPNLKAAIADEKEGIRAYGKMAAKTKRRPDRAVLQKILQQEQQHKSALEKMQRK